MPLTTPDLAETFRKTLMYSKPWEAQNCGTWIGSFSANNWARMHDVEMALMVIDRHMKLAVSPNLTSYFTSAWEIDSNFGITATIAQMLLQSHLGEIHLLSALPKSWPAGSVKGLRARGGFEVDIEWKDGVLTTATIKSLLGNTTRIRYDSNTIQLKTQKAKSYIKKLTDF